MKNIIKTSGIYKITSPSGKIYIGQTNNIQDRVRRYKHSYCKGQRYLYSSIEKYGWDSHKFEVLEECPICDLNTKESYYIGIYNSTNREIGMNLQSGGDKCIETEETRILKKLNHPKRVSFYAERDGIVQKFDSMNDAEKILGVTRKSIREQLKDPNKKIGKYSYSYEYPTTITNNKRTRIQTNETRAKISKNHASKKKIYVVDNNKIREFESITAASKELGDSKKVIWFAINNPSRTKSKYSYHLEYPVLNLE